MGKSIPFINIDKHPEKFHRVYYILSVLPSEDGLEKKKNAGNARKIFESLSGTKRRDAERFLQRIKSGVAKKFSITMKDEKFIADEADVRNLRTKKDSYEFFMDVPGRELFVKGLGKVEIFGKKLISALLLFFVSNAGKGFTSEQLFTFVWGDKFIEESSAPDVRINILRLRALVEPDRNNPRFIKHSKAVKKEKGIYYFEKDIDICLIKESP
ncbi:MAG: helix-turn-helix domain-containing protein [Firmicutes bacterium]|nr:helix-turn-helix domain-containing protein [Bacillota bacterium]